MPGEGRDSFIDRMLVRSSLQRSSWHQFWGFLTAILATFILTCGLVGCGGGTRGTGDQLKTLVVGTVVDTSGGTVPGATVTQLETGDSTTTDDQGRFALEVVVEDGAARLLIEREGFEGSATLTGLSPGDQTTPIEFSITIDLVSGIVTDVTVDDSGPRPTPHPTAGPTPRPIGTPNGVSGEREHSIRGRVVNQIGSPVPNVRLSVAGSGSVVSGGNGRFSLLVRTSSARIRVAVRFGKNRGSFVVSGLPTGRDAEVDITVRITQSSAPQFQTGEIVDPLFSVGLERATIR